ncbi:hypothetical protein G647_05960 [Cladophialophora carrionii CBS 160.54]|uniref:Uncharacterized protein n=1 Tax=Cladophialophora carrionii CBS 160.54 TaxID=1279043 RepID=V9D4W0_9EURO|nr:uncharacterized protein G647_05960 [Cladophialophora carrionii CBS 160.54]ETI21890.1 hypothetical protein G647_05960 [Cladophialophora carrionii CBS 160.54]
MASSESPKVAVLYQALEPPVIHGVRKPRKPGGYRDSGTDITYVLQSSNVNVLTQAACPDPQNDDDWCWPDTEEGILAAVDKGATHLWANTILFSSHPLQTSSKLNSCSPHIKVVWQPPRLVEQFDDKEL